MVIQYLQSLGDNSKIGTKGAWSETSLVDGTHGGQCWSSELYAFDRYRGFKPEGMLLSLPTFTKKKAYGALPRQLFFCCFSPEDQNLCVVQHQKEYEKQTEAFWPRTGKLITPIFLSRIRPHALTSGISVYCSRGERPVIRSGSRHFPVQGSFSS